MPSPEQIPAIVGLGAARGERVITNQMIDHDLGQRPGMTDRLMRMTGAGISSRYWAEEGTSTSGLAEMALIQALKMAGVEGKELKAFVVATSTPDYQTVSVAAQLQHALGLPQNVRTRDISSACPGFVQALYDSMSDLSSTIGRGGPQVAIGAEVTSIGLSTKKPLVYPLFGDAAGAAIVNLVTPDNGAPTNMGFSFGADGGHAEALYVPGGGSVHGTTHETVDQDLHSLTMPDGKLVADLAVKNMTEHAKLALKEAGVPVEDVTLLVPHQANLQIMKDTADALGIPQNKMIVTVNSYGNTSAASIPTAMWEAYESGRMKRNDMVAFATFGAGMIVAAGVIPMIGLPNR